MDPPSVFTSSPLQNTPPNDPPKPVLVAPTKTRNRLSPGGFAILEAYWSKNSNLLQPPPLKDRKDLTRTIKNLPGCSFWSDSNTSEWFKRRRKKCQRDTAHTSKLVSPSNNALQHLGVLLKSQPNPSPDVIKTWATLLAHEGGSTAVEIWIGYITQVVQTSNRPSDCALSPSANLPTPAGTVTPEPPMPQASGSSNQDLPLKMKFDPANSPVLASLEIRPPQSTATSPSSTTTESPISPFHQMQPPVTPLRVVIEDAVHSSQHPTDMIRPLPNDADEFVAMFAPYEAKLTRLLHILESERQGMSVGPS